MLKEKYLKILCKRPDTDNSGQKTKNLKRKDFLVGKIKDL
jgi:hypothetical protein